MAQIIQFPASARYADLRVRGGSLHKVAVRITDDASPEEARWHMQFPIQRAGRFGSHGGFTNKVARRRQWHYFEVTRTWLLKRFLLDIQQLVLEGRASVEVDGVRVRLAARRAA